MRFKIKFCGVIIVFNFSYKHLKIFIKQAVISSFVIINFLLFYIRIIIISLKNIVPI